MLFGREVIVRGQRWLFDPSGRLVYPVDPGPYDPCWCFSGRKFRFCHMRRHLEPAPSIHDGIALWESAPELRICLHPDAPIGCSSKIVDAHTVQRRGEGLQGIARAGKVYGVKLHPRFFLKRDMRLEPTLLGINEASTFTGFCDHHDGPLFRALETREFAATPEQLFLLNYRCIVRRLHSNQQAVRDAELWSNADRGLSPDEQRRFFIAMEFKRETDAVGLANTRQLKEIYDARWRASDFATNALVVRLHGAPELVCSSIVDVQFDFSGHPVAPWIAPAHLCFTMLASAGGGIAVWSWLGSNPAAEQLTASFRALPEEEQPRAVLRYALELLDQLYFSPLWWDTLDPTVKNAVIQHVTAHVQPYWRRTSTALLEDGVRATLIRSAAVERVSV